MLGFDEYMQVPGYLGKETWLTEPLAGLVRATLELEEERITLDQLIEMPHVFHSPLGTSEASLDRYLQSLGHSRTISVNSQSYVRRRHREPERPPLVLPSMVAELLASHWPLKSLPCPTTCRTITSTASGTRSTGAFVVSIFAITPQGAHHPGDDTGQQRAVGVTLGEGDQSLDMDLQEGGQGGDVPSFASSPCAFARASCPARSCSSSP